jgi:Protein of unknown function (DUF2948)
MSSALLPHDESAKFFTMSDAGNFLKLAAFDADDLAVVSAQLQDAVLTVGNITYLPRKQKLALVVNRFDWEDAGGRNAPPFRRRLAGLQIARVRSVRCRNIRQNDKDAVLMMLSVGFEPRDPPSGEIVLTFAGGGDLRLDVECIEAMLEDLGPEWQTAAKPAHETSGAG